ncbi:N-acetyltransferase 9-like protein isoform X1 [Planococcus citri]|uniref:N-acetyltransferase 9-like protein isoform X1 n=2 Tax=Planococcus citri TaxID=170843 RepID=UPI0031F7B515
MKLNSSTAVVGKTVILVPYKKKHVPKYHKWMQRKDLQEATASEPLSIEEEHEMQQTWFRDDDKCTFIVLDKEIMDRKHDEIEAMIGDANLYLSTAEDERIAECGIMIAENMQRGKGKGFETLTLLLKYGCDFLNIEKYVAKISFDNVSSTNLFKKVGFQMIEENHVFSESTLSLSVDERFKTWLKETIADGYSVTTYVE